jgi:hypothetical protein
MAELQGTSDPRLCPLCGEANACALAGNAAADTCWCASVTITTAVLERVPPAARGVACVCRRCAAALAPQPAS